MITSRKTLALSCRDRGRSADGGAEEGAGPRSDEEGDSRAGEGAGRRVAARGGNRRAGADAAAEEGVPRSAGPRTGEPSRGAGGDAVAAVVMAFLRGEGTTITVEDMKHHQFQTWLQSHP